MHQSQKKLLAAVALITATLGLSSAYAGKSFYQTSPAGTTSVRVSEEWKADGFEVQIKDGKAVGMSGVKKDGTRFALKQDNKPTCATSCPAGQTLSCWEDEEQLMSTCVCTSSGGGGGSVLNRRVYSVPPPH